MLRVTTVSGFVWNRCAGIAVPAAKRGVGSGSDAAFKHEHLITGAHLEADLPPTPDDHRVRATPQCPCDRTGMAVSAKNRLPARCKRVRAI